MTMRLQLVIEGDGSGAKKALEETSRAVEDLGKKAEDAGRKAGAGAKGFEWLSDEEERARLGLKGAGEEASQVAGGFEKAGEAAGKAARGIADAGESAVQAQPALSKVSSALIGLAAGVGATVLAEGFKLALGAATEFFHEVTSSGPMIERTLTAHGDLVSRLKGHTARRRARHRATG